MKSFDFTYFLQNAMGGLPAFHESFQSVVLIFGSEQKSAFFLA